MIVLIIHFIIIIIVIIFLIIKIQEIDTKQEKIKIIIPIFSGILLIILTSLIYIISPEKIPEDYITLHRPYLTPEFSVIKIDSNKIYCDFKIENTDKLPAKNIYYSIITPHLFQSKSEEIHGNDLAPGQTFSLFPHIECISI